MHNNETNFSFYLLSQTFFATAAVSLRDRLDDIAFVSSINYNVGL